ncbi:MAG: ROK family transcriptional regulator [Clostridia bacterium]|nr:ROK family transcriptional regulator [Clostridia bacterium]
MLANNSKSNKIQNRQTILKLLAVKAPISRVELSALSGLSKMSLTNIISEFKQEGLITEVGVDTTAEGKRKPVLLELSDGAICALGVTVADKEIKSCYADIKGNVLSFDACPLPTGDWPNAVISYIKTALSKSPFALSGIGVSFDATVSFEQAENVRKQLLETEFPISLFFGSAAQSALLAEKRYGGAKGIDSVLYAAYHNGLCCAYYVNKKLLQGHRSRAGFIPCADYEEAIAKLKGIIYFTDPQAVLFEENFAEYVTCREVERIGISVRICTLGEQAPILGSAALVFENEYFN